MIGTEIIRAVLKTVFGHEHYVRMYEVIDDDSIFVMNTQDFYRTGVSYDDLVRGLEKK